MGVGGRWGGHLFEAGHLVTFPAFRMGAYSRWTLIQGWALIRINTVVIKKKIGYFISYSDFLPVTCSILTGSMWYRADAARMLYEN